MQRSHQRKIGSGPEGVWHLVTAIQNRQYHGSLVRRHLTRLFDEFQSFCWVLEVNYYGLELAMAKFSSCRAHVGADLDVHCHLLHEVAESIYGLDVPAHKQDSDAYNLRWHGTSIVDLVSSVDSQTIAQIARASGISICPRSKATTNASTTAGSKLAPAPETIICFASNGVTARRYGRSLVNVS